MKCYTCKGNIDKLMIEGRFNRFICKCNDSWIYVNKKRIVPSSDTDILRYNILFSLEGKSYMIDAEKDDEVCVESYNRETARVEEIIFEQPNFYLPLLLDDNNVIDMASIMKKLKLLRAFV